MGARTQSVSTTVRNLTFSFTCKTSRVSGCSGGHPAARVRERFSAREAGVPSAIGISPTVMGRGRGAWDRRIGPGDAAAGEAVCRWRPRAPSEEKLVSREVEPAEAPSPRGSSGSRAGGGGFRPRTSVATKWRATLLKAERRRRARRRESTTLNSLDDSIETSALSGDDLSTADVPPLEQLEDENVDFDPSGSAASSAPQPPAAAATMWCWMPVPVLMWPSPVAMAAPLALATAPRPPCPHAAVARHRGAAVSWSCQSSVTRRGAAPPCRPGSRRSSGARIGVAAGWAASLRNTFIHIEEDEPRARPRRPFSAPPRFPDRGDCAVRFADASCVEAHATAMGYVGNVGAGDLRDLGANSGELAQSAMANNLNYDMMDSVNGPAVDEPAAAGCCSETRAGGAAGATSPARASAL